jgi:hypothetical protein
MADQPFKAEMMPEKSLYDLAARVFAADQAMLCEHFHCVPPIIAYSNRTFYQNQILPLRIPRASERLEPPLVDIYVESGLRDAHDRNDCEAQAIADEIGAILANEKLAQRTIASCLASWHRAGEAYRFCRHAAVRCGRTAAAEVPLRRCTGVSRKRAAHHVSFESPIPGIAKPCPETCSISDSTLQRAAPRIECI